MCQPRSSTSTSSPPLPSIRPPREEDWRLEWTTQWTNCPKTAMPIGTRAPTTRRVPTHSPPPWSRLPKEKAKTWLVLAIESTLMTTILITSHSRILTNSGRGQSRLPLLTQFCILTLCSTPSNPKLARTHISITLLVRNNCHPGFLSRPRPKSQPILSNPKVQKQVQFRLSTKACRLARWPKNQPKLCRRTTTRITAPKANMISPTLSITPRMAITAVVAIMAVVAKWSAKAIWKTIVLLHTSQSSQHLAPISWTLWATAEIAMRKSNTHYCHSTIPRIKMHFCRHLPPIRALAKKYLNPTTWKRLIYCIPRTLVFHFLVPTVIPFSPPLNF